MNDSCSLLYELTCDVEVDLRRSPRTPHPAAGLYKASIKAAADRLDLANVTLCGRFIRFPRNKSTGASFPITRHSHDDRSAPSHNNNVIMDVVGVGVILVILAQCHCWK